MNQPGDCTRLFLLCFLFAQRFTKLKQIFFKPNTDNSNSSGYEKHNGRLGKISILHIRPNKGGRNDGGNPRNGGNEQKSRKLYRTDTSKVCQRVFWRSGNEK